MKHIWSSLIFGLLFGIVGAVTFSLSFLHKKQPNNPESVMTSSNVLLWEINGKTNVAFTVTNKTGVGWTTAKILFQDDQLSIVAFYGTNEIDSRVLYPNKSKMIKGYLGQQSLGQQQRTKK